MQGKCLSHCPAALARCLFLCRRLRGLKHQFKLSFRLNTGHKPHYVVCLEVVPSNSSKAPGGAGFTPRPPSPNTNQGKHVFLKLEPFTTIKCVLSPVAGNRFQQSPGGQTPKMKTGPPLPATKLSGLVGPPNADGLSFFGSCLAGPRSALLKTVLRYGGLAVSRKKGANTPLSYTCSQNKTTLYCLHVYPQNWHLPNAGA